ncbi:MAG: hypothetical protein ACRDH9_11640 [Actinomycetota bacterium]
MASKVGGIVLVAALPSELSDALTLISGCSLLGGALTWAWARLWMLLSSKVLNLERWVLDGVGYEAIFGILFAVGYLAL